MKPGNTLIVFIQSGPQDGLRGVSASSDARGVRSPCTNVRNGGPLGNGAAIKKWKLFMIYAFSNTSTPHQRISSGAKHGGSHKVSSCTSRVRSLEILS